MTAISLSGGEASSEEEGTLGEAHLAPFALVPASYHEMRGQVLSIFIGDVSHHVRSSQKQRGFLQFHPEGRVRNRW